MLVFLPRSIRSSWAPLVVVLGLAFALLGVLAGATESDDVVGVFVGLASAVIGLCFACGGARSEVLVTPAGMTVRELFSVQTYPTEKLRSIGAAEEQHEKSRC